jgi:tetratricopeptide (TPR) repeat protein
MLRYFTIILIFITFPSALCGNNNDSIFLYANSLYHEGKYEEAQEAYHEILNSGFFSAEVYFNLGNAYFRSNKYGKARLYYEKALLISPRDPAIKSNLAFTESLLTDKFEQVPVFFLRQWIIDIRKNMHPDNWAILSLALFITAFVLLVIFLFSKSVLIKKTGFYSGSILFILSVVSLIFTYFSSRYLKNSGTAILTAPSVIVRSAPRDTGKELFIIHEGAKVWLEDTIGEWQEIKLPDGRIGWLPSSVMEKI